MLVDANDSLEEVMPRVYRPSLASSSKSAVRVDGGEVSFASESRSGSSTGAIYNMNQLVSRHNQDMGFMLTF